MSRPSLASGPVIDAMATCSTVRSFHAERVSDSLIEAVIWAATRAPSPRNEQPWRFIVVRDPGRRADIAELVRHRADELEAHIPDLPDDSQRKMWHSVVALLRQLGDVPVLVFACGELAVGDWSPSREGQLSAVYGATQNLMLAARSLGLGTGMTVMHKHAGQPLRELLGLPESVDIMATIVMGWPEKPPRPVRRRPLPDVLMWEHYG